MEDSLLKALNKVGKMYVSQLKSNISRDRNVASGELLQSIRYKVSDDGINFFWKEYLGAISEGKKPSQKNPSFGMISRIAKWMQYKKMSIRGYRGRFQAKNAKNYRRAAFAIARGINRKGWSGSGVIMRSYRQIENNISEEILKSFKKGIEENIDKLTTKK